MTVDLNEWRTRLILEALRTLDEKWSSLIASAAERGDEDTAADCGNDLMMLMTLREELEELAMKTFKSDIASFSDQGFAPTTMPSGKHPEAA